MKESPVEELIPGKGINKENIDTAMKNIKNLLKVLKSCTEIEIQLEELRKKYNDNKYK